MKLFLLRHWKAILIGSAIIISLIVWNQYASHQGKLNTIKTASATRKTFIKTITSSGKTQADTAVDLKFQTSGTLSWVGVKEGDNVAASQTIASLDSREVQLNLEKALRAYSSERNDYEQTWRVTYDGKSANDAFTDTIKRILEKNQWDLEKAVLDVELAHLAVTFSKLTTPIAGIVTRIDTPVAGVNITPASAVFSIADPSSIVFTATVDETEIGGLSIGQPATIALDAFPEATFSGTISYISYTSQQSSGGSTVFPVKIKFSAPQSLRIGLNGDISIDVARIPDAITVPLEAVRDGKNGTYVYKKSGSTFVETLVTTGQKNDDEIVITDGLNEHDNVVTKGFSAIQQ